MKAIIKSFIVLLCCCMAMTLVTCLDICAKSRKVKLNKKKVTIYVGKKKQVKLLNAKKSKVKWSSTKKKVATVSKKGVVRAVSVGKATIKAKYKKKTYKVKVTVKKKGGNSVEPKVNGSEVSQGAFLVDYYYQNKNILVSPKSLSMAIGMLANGADDVAKKDIEKYFGKTVTDFNVDAGGLIGRNDGVLKIANSVWYKNGFTVKESFKNDISSYYKGEFKSAQMDNSTVDAINKWAKDHTDNMIDHILGYRDINPVLTRVVLANALLFDAKWTWNFDPNDTDKVDFTAIDGSKKKVDMMNDTDYSYYENDYATAFEKTYCKNEDYSFIGILPKKKGDFKLSDLDIEGLIKSSKSGRISIGLPKFSYAWNSDLDGALMQTDLKCIYGPEPHLNGILNDEELSVDSVIQSCKIDVDEGGTKAAAVTAVISKALSMRPDKKIILDRPFAYLIKDNKTGGILFMGKVVKL